MKNIIIEIIVGVISSLIVSGIVYSITAKFLWNLSFPLWIWLIISIGIALLIYMIKRIILNYKIKEFMSEFTEGSFGDSYVYTWKYKRSKSGIYSAYGYEATDIHTKSPVSEINEKDVFVYGHKVPECTIKMFIQLTMLMNIDKKLAKKLKPTLEYLNWTEESQKHKLLH